MTAPAQISPFGALYIDATPPVIVTNPGWAPCGANKQTKPVTFSWTDTGATNYTLQVFDGCAALGTPTIMTGLARSDLTIVAGVCSYTPTLHQVAAGLTSAWYVWESLSTNPSVYSGPMLFVVNPPGYADFDTAARSVYRAHYMACGPRLVDFSTYRGQDTAGCGIWPRGQWVRVSAAHAVPTGAVAMTVLLQTIQGVVSGEPVIGFETKQSLSDPDPEPTGGMPYDSPHRSMCERWIPLDADRCFYFRWSNAFNGSPSCQDAGTCETSTLGLSLTAAGLYLK